MWYHESLHVVIIVAYVLIETTHVVVAGKNIVTCVFMLNALI